MTTAPPAWDPAQYRRFETERERAAQDLLARIPDEPAPTEVWDLGCGEGRQAALLKHRHPQARVHGLDSSEAMLEQARRLDADIDWRRGDIARWTPERGVDLILANASLQWLPDHATLFPQLAAALAPGGVLAVQMPMAWESRHHETLRAVAAEGPWASRLSGVDTIGPLLTAEAYYDALSGVCGEIDIWSTTYLHALEGADPVLEWMKGAALRPYLTALADNPAMRSAFLSALGDALSQAFPARPDGRVLLPFPRLFLMARKR